MVGELLAGWHDQYPDVELRRHLVRGHPVGTLVEESRGAEMLVIGSRGRGGFKGCCWARSAAACCTGRRARWPWSGPPPLPRRANLSEARPDQVSAGPWPLARDCGAVRHGRGVRAGAPGAGRGTSSERAAPCSSLFPLVDQAAGRYLHWGVIQISVTNLAIIGLMVVVFVLALLLPFPGGRDRPDRGSLGRDRRRTRGGPALGATRPTTGPPGCATACRTVVPPGQALPDRQPAYVASWIYVFGVLTLAALVVVLASGVRARRRRRRRGGTPPALGHFVNSLHLWSVELFFAFMVIHLWGKFWMAAWRGQPRADLDHRRGRLPGLDRHRVHRLPVAVQLRLPVDQHRRPRTASTRSASARGSTCSTPARCCCGTSCCCRSWSACSTVLHVVLVRRHGVVPPLDAEERVSAMATPTAAPPRTPPDAAAAPRTRTTFPTRPYDLVKEFVIALLVVVAAHRRPGRRVLLPGREGDHHARLGHGGAGRRRRHRHRRAGRHHDQRHLRRRRTTAAPTGQKLGPLPLQKWGGVRHPGRLRPGPRARTRWPAAPATPR